jgi:hypothetical protein
MWFDLGVGHFVLHPAEVNEFRNRCPSALRIFHSEQFVSSELDHFGPFEMGKNIELLVLNRIEDHRQRPQRC